MANKFGLSRNIPDDVKRAVRQHCGFGCAICGTTITEYEHFFPDFVDASKHDPKKIVLLCPTHHSMVTKGIIPKEKVQESWAQPAAKDLGYSKTEHPWFKGIPSLKMGGGPLVQGTPIPIQVRGTNIIEFEPPEEGSNLARISAKLQDASGNNILSIDKNEWRVLSGSWDFKCVGNRYIFLDKFNAPSLILKMNPPNWIAIELLLTSIDGIPVKVTEEKLMIGSSTFSGGLFSNCRVGFAFG
ncbi:hypothetical protein [Novosphingobium malaysiense]|uniref:hypothetical protein n=1 Tax=Novosphingobium malaysiense TaxID=1348853 RepID=UPI0012E0402A|nr:hypothetical protein [Novosphingobium malaysiense]